MYAPVTKSLFAECVKIVETTLLSALSIYLLRRCFSETRRAVTSSITIIILASLAMSAVVLFLGLSITRILRDYKPMLRQWQPCMLLYIIETGSFVDLKTENHNNYNWGKLTGRIICRKQWGILNIEYSATMSTKFKNSITISETPSFRSIYIFCLIYVFFDFR